MWTPLERYQYSEDISDFIDKKIKALKIYKFQTFDRGVIKEREVDDLSAGHGKIMDFLQDEGVIKALNEAFATFGKFLSKQLFLTLDTGNKDPEEVGTEVLQFIKGQSDNVLADILNFIDYANSLVGSKNKHD